MHSTTAAPLARNLRLYYAFRLLREFQLWIPIWIVYLTIERGFSLAQVGAAEGLFLILLTILEVPTGAVADRWGRRLSLALGSAMLGVAIFVFALVDSYTVLLISFSLWAVAETLMSGADQALLYDTLKVLGREEEYEKHAGRGEAALWVGAGIATAIGAPVAQILSSQATIFIGAGTLVVTTAIVLAMVEPPRAVDDDEPEAAGLSYLGSVGRSLRIAWSIPTVRYMILFGGALVASTVATGFLVQPFLLRQDVEIGVVFSLLQVPGMAMGAIGAFVAYRVVGRVGLQRYFALVLVLAVGMYTGLATVDFLGAIVFFYALTLVHSSVEPVATGYLNRRIPSSQRATILSLRSLTVGLMLAPMTPIVGIVAEQRSLSQVFALSAVVAAVSGVVTGALWMRAHRQEVLPENKDDGSSFAPPSAIQAPPPARPSDPD